MNRTHRPRRIALPNSLARGQGLNGHRIQSSVGRGFDSLRVNAAIDEPIVRAYDNVIPYRALIEYAADFANAGPVIGKMPVVEMVLLDEGEACLRQMEIEIRAHRRVVIRPACVCCEA